MECDGGAHVSHHFLVIVTLPDDGTASQANGVSDITVRVFLHDDLKRKGSHYDKINPEGLKTSAYPAPPLKATAGASDTVPAGFR